MKRAEARTLLESYVNAHERLRDATLRNLQTPGDAGVKADRIDALRDCNVLRTQLLDLLARVPEPLRKESKR